MLIGVKVRHRIERQLGIEGRVDRMAAEADQQGVAVGRRLGDRIRRKVATSAGTVLDQHGPPKGRRERRRDRPRHGVGGAAGRGSDHELDRSRWIVVSTDGEG
jgi:hypothetical protein